MNRALRILQSCVPLCSAAAVWLSAVEARAVDSAGGKPGEGSINDYMLSYVVVILGIALGILVVAKASGRRDRERPAGYVEKDLTGHE